MFSAYLWKITRKVGQMHHEPIVQLNYSQALQVAVVGFAVIKMSKHVKLVRKV